MPQITELLNVEAVGTCSNDCCFKEFPCGTNVLLQDPEIGQQAGLASMETLDDSTGEKTEKLTNGEDGMESVKLDSEVRNATLF